MKRLAAAAVPLALLSLAGLEATHAIAQSNAAQAMTVTRNGTQASVKGPAQNFVGAVRVDPLFQPREGNRAAGAYVNFEPGARSAWHTHPAGQTLVVTAGTGWVQQEGGAKQEIKPGDVIWTPPGVKHWHGATASTGMTHLAINEQVSGKSVDWMEKVSDEQYAK